jgi:hypothetical protein
MTNETASVAYEAPRQDRNCDSDQADQTSRKPALFNDKSVVSDEAPATTYIRSRTSTTLFSPRGASIAESRVGHPPPKRVRWRPHRGASQIMWKLHRAIPINRVLQEWPPPKASDVGQGTPDLQSGYPLNIRSVTGGALERPPHDSSLLRRAILIAIGQKLKAERDPPTDLTPELRNILRRLEEQKDNEK